MWPRSGEILPHSGPLGWVGEEKEGNVSLFLLPRLGFVPCSVKCKQSNLCQQLPFPQTASNSSEASGLKHYECTSQFAKTHNLPLCPGGRNRKCVFSSKEFFGEMRILDQTTFGGGCKIWSSGLGILNKYFELRSIKICIFLNPPPTTARFDKGKKIQETILRWKRPSHLVHVGPNKFGGIWPYSYTGSNALWYKKVVTSQPTDSGHTSSNLHLDV